MDKYFVQKEVDCSECCGTGKVLHTRQCAEDDRTGLYECYNCKGTGIIKNMSPCDIPADITRLTAELQTAWNQLHEEVEKERKAVTERDVAIEDLSSAADCSTCKFYEKELCAHGVGCYVWRGAKVQSCP